MRGLGKQNVAALITGLGFSLIGISSGYVFCFVAGYGLFGLWVGLCVGIVSTALISVVVLLCFTDFEKVITIDGTQGKDGGRVGHKQHSYRLMKSDNNVGIFSLANDDDDDDDDMNDSEFNLDSDESERVLMY